MGYFLLSVVYAVGIVGVYLPLHPDFLLLTPLNLLFSMGVVLYYHPKRSLELIYGLVLVYFGSWLLECVGVQTGLLFGNYAYGPVLGPKVLATPLMIGINWVMLVYAMAALAWAWLPRVSANGQAMVGASLMMSLDFLIEPVAVHYNFWKWIPAQDHWFWVAPIQNYVVWWIAAWVFIRLFLGLVPKFENPIAIFLFVLQVVFFAALLSFI